MERSQIAGVKKIAVFRATALGDLILAVPALHALHETYPQAEIVYLGRAWHTSFLPGRVPGLGRVIALPPARGEHIDQGHVIDLDYRDEFISAMQAERFDIAAQMQGGGFHSNPFILALNARVSLGAKTPESAPLDRWIPYVYHQHETVRCLEIVSLAGAETGSANLSPHLPVLPKDLEKAGRALSQIHKPFVVIHSGTTDPRRQWLPNRFASVADWCARELDFDVVLTGTEIDAHQITRVKAAMQTSPIDLTGQLDLAGLTGLLSRAEVVVSNDTGPLHLALAVGTRVVGMFMDEYSIGFMPLSRKLFFPLIAWDRSCPRCGKFCDKIELDNPIGECSHRVSFLESISVDHVISALRQLLLLERVDNLF